MANIVKLWGMKMAFTRKLKIWAVDKAEIRLIVGESIFYEFDPVMLEIRNFHFFDNAPGERLPDLLDYPVAENSHANAESIKLVRWSVRLVGKKLFQPVATSEELLVKLFGSAP